MSGPAGRVSMHRTEDLDPAQRTAIIELCVAAHHVEEFRRMFDHFIPSGGRHFLGWSGEELVSHAVVTTRWARPDGLPPLRTAYVDAVSTLPEHEGRGHGSAVMRRLADEIGDHAIGCLQTDREGFYERLGWAVWRGPLAGREYDGSVTPTPEQRGVMVLRLATSPPLDLDTSLSIERQPDRFWE